MSDGNIHKSDKIGMSQMLLLTNLQTFVYNFTPTSKDKC
jgi:hypothetical protein